MPFDVDSLLGSKIDIHTHLTENFSAEDRIAANKVLGFSKCVLVSIDEEKSIVSGANDSSQACEVAKDYPHQFAWLCDVSPFVSNVHEMLQDFKEKGARGVGEFTHRIHFNSALMDSYLTWCEDLHFPFLFHMSPVDSTAYYGIIDDPRLPGLEFALKQHPDMIFIGHSQSFWFEMSKTDEIDPSIRNGFPAGKIYEKGRLWELMEKYPNLYCDLSANSGSNAITRDEEYGLSFLETFQDRLMYGSDWFSGAFRHMLSTWLDSKVLSGQLSLIAYRKIVRENAIRVFDL